MNEVSAVKHFDLLKFERDFNKLYGIAPKKEVCVPSQSRGNKIVSNTDFNKIISDVATAEILFQYKYRFLYQSGGVGLMHGLLIYNIHSGGIQIFCQPVPSIQKSYFSAGSVTKSHVFFSNANRYADLI